MTVPIASTTASASSSQVRTASRRASGGLALLLAVACGGGAEPAPCAPGAATDALDLLLMVDSSGSLDLEQERFVAQLPRLLRALASGDHDEDGAPERAPVRSLHVGVVTADMGSGGYSVPTCESGLEGARLGDDGRFVESTRTGVAGCSDALPSFLTFGAGEDADRRAEELRCLALTESLDGCGFEQPLESVLKALSPAAPTDWTAADYAPPVFVEGTRGHGDGAHAGFSRADAVLAILTLTDEDDCSVRDLELFDLSSTRYDAGISFRCVVHQDALHDVARYVRGEDGRSGLASLRRDPSRVVLGVLAGIPPEVVPATPDEPEDFDWILTHPAMQSRIDASTGRVLRSCNGGEVGVTAAPARLVRVADGLSQAGARSFVRTLCGTESAPEIQVRPAIDALLFHVGEAMAGTTCAE